MEFVKLSISSDSNNLVYIGDSLGIENSAMKEHAICIAKIFNELNYNVIFVSNRGWRPGESAEKYEYDGTETFHCYYSETKSLPNDIFRKWYRRYQALTGLNHWRVIRRILEIYKPSVIVFYGYICINKVIDYSKKNNIKLLVERTDWFTKTSYTDLYDKLIWCKYTDWCIRHWSLRADGIIAISNFFYEFYKNKVPTIQIPALCNFGDDIVIEHKRDRILKIVYAGTPGNKDLLLPVIEAVKKLNESEIRVTLDIIGISEYMGITNEEVHEMGIYFHGRLSHDVTLEFVSKSDISVLIRRMERYAIAGFSTKLAESMWLGVPVLCNSIGGTDSCISDGINGFLVDGETSNEVLKKISMIQELGGKELDQICKNAFEYAHVHFSYLNYVEMMNCFMQRISKG